MTRPAAPPGCLSEGAGFPKVREALGPFPQPGLGEGQQGPRNCPSLGLRSSGVGGRGGAVLGRGGTELSPGCVPGAPWPESSSPDSEDPAERLGSAQIPLLHIDGSQVLVFSGAPWGSASRLRY